MNINSACILEDRGILFIDGVDAKDFLQNIITNDINKVNDHNSCFASLLNPQGKFLFEFLVIQHKKGYFIDCEKNQINELFKQLSLYKLRSSVQILNLSNEFVVAALSNEKFLEFDAVLVLQPTTPVRKIRDIEKAINIFKEKRYSSLVSLVQMKEHPYECVEIKKDKWNYLKKNPKKKITGRQQYKNNFFFIDGSFYIAKLDFYLKHKSFLKENITKFYIQEKKWPVDIDYLDDLKVAETFLKN